VKYDKTDGACGTYEVKKDTYSVRNLKGRNNLQDLGIYGRIILKRILQYWMERVYSVLLTLNRNKRRAIVITAMNIWVT